MNFQELLKTLEAIDKGQKVDEFLGFGKKKEQPAPAQGQQPPGQSAQPAQPGDAAKAAVKGNSGALGHAARALSGRDAQIRKAMGEPVDEAKADKDYDGDGEVESDKDEVWGSRMKAAKQAGKMDEEIVDECGMMGDAGAMSAPKQQDSVTMNVSMNGSGAGGIRDLLNVLKDIQDGPSDKMSGNDIDMGPDMDSDTLAGPDILLKKNIDSMAQAIDDDFANSAPGDEGPKMGGVDMMTKSGDDLHKEKGAYPKAAGGDNAMKLKGEQTFRVNDDLKIRLENLYNEIKQKNQLSEISGELADKVATARRKQADDARDKDPKSDDAKRKKSKADDAQWNWIKRMSRDNYRGKSQAEINKGYADDADKNTKRGWSND